MKAATLRTLRRLHLYAAVVFAPAIIFFAFSGVLQTFGFHEARGGHGEPPAWIAIIANLHQHQRLHRAERQRPAPASTETHARVKSGDDRGVLANPQPQNTALLKIFTGLMGLGLIVASLLGIAVALGTRTTRRISVVMLAIGIVLPATLALS